MNERTDKIAAQIAIAALTSFDGIDAESYCDIYDIAVENRLPITQTVLLHAKDTNANPFLEKQDAEMLIDRLNLKEFQEEA